MAQDREIVDIAYPGDIIGLFDTGIFRIGDSLTAKSGLPFSGLPSFPAEHFARVAAKDTMKRKQFVKGITQLSEEGAIQIFKQLDFGLEEFIIGAVGVLQFEVLEHRLKNEYGVELRMTQLPFRFARWMTETPKPPNELNLTSSTLPTEDRRGDFVLLFENEWSINWALDKNKGLKLRDMS
jgi:peptide chain release factor 3